MPIVIDFLLGIGGTGDEAEAEDDEEDDEEEGEGGAGAWFVGALLRKRWEKIK